MVGVKEFCALLLAGGMGAGSVVAVEQAKPAISKAKAKPKVQKASQRSVQQTQVSDCPSIAAPIAGNIADLAPMVGPAGFGSDSLLPIAGGAGGSGGTALLPGGGGGGGGSGPNILPPAPVPGIPQPDVWAMMVAGFGFTGLAFRRPRKSSRATS